MSKYALGIDLGTTFSSVCITREGQTEIVADKARNKYIPSIVGFNFNSEPCVGSFTKSIQTRNPQNVIFDSKRMLAQRFNDPHIQKMVNQWPFQIKSSETGNILICLDQLHKQFEPYEISGEILKYLAKVGNERLKPKERTNYVVITIPANFGEEQRQETLKAAEYANLNVLELVNEPTAAGIAYSIYNKENQYTLIFDFGGGTLDISLLHIDDLKITVMATDGDMFLGGRDFDNNTTNYLLKKLSIQKIPKKLNLKFREAVIEAKEHLSRYSSVDIDLSDFIENNEENFYCLTLDEFERINQEYINRITIPIERLLRKVNFSKEKVDSIILIGGSSNMQFVNRKLTDFFGKEPYPGINPNDAVAMGAGIIAANIKNCESLPMNLQNIEYQDICPLSIGTLVYDGTFSAIIHKDSHIPVEKVESYNTVLYRQKSFQIFVFEGENEKAKDNKYLTMFEVVNLPDSEDEIRFKIEFSLDKNGILSAKAQLVDDVNIKAEKKIDIRRIDPDIPDIDIDKLTKNNLDLFFDNVQRFVDFNKENLSAVYKKKKELDTILEKIKRDRNSSNDVDPAILRDYYRYNLFKKYFKSNPLPKFFY